MFEYYKVQLEFNMYEDFFCVEVGVVFKYIFVVIFKFLSIWVFIIQNVILLMGKMYLYRLFCFFEMVVLRKFLKRNVIRVILI